MVVGGLSAAQVGEQPKLGQCVESQGSTEMMAADTLLLGKTEWGCKEAIIRTQWNNS